MKKLIIATRSSELALFQANFIKDKLQKQYPYMEIILNKIISSGDKILDKPLALVGGKSHFTKELEYSLLDKSANLCVHSLKDVPSCVDDSFEIVAISKKQNASDGFFSYKYKNFNDLPKNAVVGTTSLRRAMQLKYLRDDIVIKELRGNVNTRLKKLKDGLYDCIILASIGVKRLGLDKDIPYVDEFSFKQILPPMGQGALAIEILKEDKYLKNILSFLNDEQSYFLASLERDFIYAIGASCSSPVAVFAFMFDNKVEIHAKIGYSDGSKILKDKLSCLYTSKNAKGLGKNLAKQMIANGAKELLDEACKRAFKNYEAPRI